CGRDAGAPAPWPHRAAGAVGGEHVRQRAHLPVARHVADRPGHRPGGLGRRSHRPAAGGRGHPARTPVRPRRDGRLCHRHHRRRLVLPAWGAGQYRGRHGRPAGGAWLRHAASHFADPHLPPADALAGRLHRLVVRVEAAPGTVIALPEEPVMSSKVPVCVDLDGSLIHSDLLLESFLLLIKRNPLYLLLIPFWLLGGKARLKAEIASRVQLDGAWLPYTKPFVAWLKEQKRQGRALWLCTASDHRLAQAVADHLGIFDGVLASDGQRNLSGSNKAAELVKRFGEKGFDYCGNHRVDLAVWRHARAAIVVNASQALVAQARAVTEVATSFAPMP